MSEARVTWGLEQDPENLVPFGGVPTANHWGNEFMYDSLLEWDRDLAVNPALAETYEMPDEATYVFKLRRGVRFHDGTELTADDVCYSVALQHDPPPPGRAPYAQFGPIAEVDALDRYTVRFRMSAPDATLPGFLAWGRYSAIVPAGLYDKLDPAAEGTGTGPFRLAGYTPGDSLTYVRSPWFWKEGLPHLDQLTLTILPDERERLAALRSGAIDGATLSADAVRELEDAHDLVVLKGLFAAHRELQFTVKAAGDKPWNDIRVRQAINRALDRDALIAEVYHGDAEYSSVVPPGFGDWPLPDAELRREHQAHDAAEARRQLALAGFPEGFPVELLVLSEPSDVPRCAAVIRRQLGEVGVDCRLTALPSGPFFELRDRGDFELALVTRGIRGDISGFFAEFATTAPGYERWFSGWRQPRLAELIATGVAVSDPAQRRRIYAESQRLLLDECVHIPICQPYKHQVVRRHLRDMYVSYSDFNTGLREVWLDPTPRGKRSE